MKITVEDLERLGACVEGISDFTKQYPSGFSEDWTRAKQIEILKSPFRMWLQWAWTSGLVPMWSMANENLRNTNLSRVGLIKANLSGTNLNRTNLSGANLSGADLSGASLIKANLNRANLSGTNLSGADLNGSLRCSNDIPIHGWVRDNSGRLVEEETK